ncbi:hypothetical protein MCC93_01380 [Morococcus cerebrosus]|uniref:Uncharacterized protein n=1 Tax=Morococcus cerebrosus TaxID=1056807 RepID=A0A0C1ELN7_9NEIS|nr:hypothetical protein MCC93_01380 [Morococcus cerebrosus]
MPVICPHLHQENPFCPTGHILFAKTHILAQNQKDSGMIARNISSPPF